MSSDPIVRIVAELAEGGWYACDGFISNALVEALAREARSESSGEGFHAAGVGSGALHRHDQQVRGDDVLWLDAEGGTEAQRECLTRFEALRLAVNCELQLGLFEFECHFARYQPGAAYSRHLDQFAQDGSRVLSCVLYLNEVWRPVDGGELRLHLPDPAGHADVIPVGGRLVSFFSARFEHEVLPAQRQRLSLTGWFRRRP